MTTPNHDFSYSVACSLCAQNGITDSTLGLELSTGKFSCTGEITHFFDELPGETAPAEVPQEVAEANRLEPEPQVEAAPVTQEVRDAEENRLVEITEKIKTGDPENTDSIYWHGKQPVVVLPPVVTDWSQCCVCRPGDAEGHYCDKHAAERGLLPEEPRFNRPLSPIVHVGEFTPLPGGDMLIGLRVPETWIGPMQSEAEGRQPPISLAEYIQELVDLGLLSYYGNEVTK